MSYLSVSTWSLHRILGPLYWTAWDANAGKHVTVVQEQPEVITLLELPAEAASRGYQAIEICHFHFPSKDVTYLEQLRSSFHASDISFDTLLLDYGNLTSADEEQRTADLDYIREWIDIASISGAKQIRIIAGEAAASDVMSIQMSASSLVDLSQYAASKGVQVITENFKPLTSTAESSLKLLALTGDSVKFITDFGNFHGDNKCVEIADTVPYSVSVHAKASYDERGLPDELEFISCLKAVKATDYDGAYVLIYDGPGDMWEGLERIKSLVKPYL